MPSTKYVIIVIGYCNPGQQKGTVADHLFSPPYVRKVRDRHSINEKYHMTKNHTVIYIMSQLLSFVWCLQAISLLVKQTFLDRFNFCGRENSGAISACRPVIGMEKRTQSNVFRMVSA